MAAASASAASSSSASTSSAVTATAITTAAITSGTAYAFANNLSFTTAPVSLQLESEIIFKGNNPRLVTKKGEIDLDQLFDMVKRAEAILCMVKADQERLERYPALQEAYDHYRIIDALCRGDEDDG